MLPETDGCSSQQSGGPCSRDRDGDGAKASTRAWRREPAHASMEERPWPPYSTADSAGTKIVRPTAMAMTEAATDSLRFMPESACVSACDVAPARARAGRSFGKGAAGGCSSTQRSTR